MSDAKNVSQNHCIPLAFATPTAHLKAFAAWRQMKQPTSNRVDELMRK